jgi:hypothetical protein
MEDDLISQLFKRLALDMPELMEGVVAFIERRTADLNEEDSAAPSSAESVAPAVLAPTPRTTPRVSCDHLALRHPGPRPHRCRCQADRISRAAWLHVAADERLEGRR